MSRNGSRQLVIGLASAWVLVAAGLASAGPILVTDFGAGATTTTFDGLGLPIHGNATPFVIDGNTYTTDNGIFRYLGPTFCSGSCFGTDTDLGYVDIELGAPALLAGLLVGPGANVPSALGDFWSATVEFFDTLDASLGSVAVSGGAPASMEFAGWGDAGGIARIRITDTNSNGLVMLIDEVTVEGRVGVPEPASLGLLGAGLAALSFMRRKRSG